MNSAKNKFTRSELADCVVVENRLTTEDQQLHAKM